MNAKQATAEAQRRWGKRGTIEQGPKTWALPFSVGVDMLGMFVTKGQGETWEDAFADADRKCEGGKK